MAILHGTWLIKSQNSCLFIWGETWRPQESISTQAGLDVAPNPFFMPPVELLKWVQTVGVNLPKSLYPVSVESAKNSGRQRSRDAINRVSTVTAEISLPSTELFIALPTDITPGENEGTFTISALHSGTISDTLDTDTVQLQPWRIEGFCLEPADAIKFLASLPLHIETGASLNSYYLGGDLRFWSQIARWSLDLISRCKFLPSLEKSDVEKTNGFISKWQAVLDSAIDTSRLEKFSKAMPLTCRTYQDSAELKVLSAELREHSALSTQHSALSSTQHSALSSTQHSSISFPIEPQKLLLDFLNTVIDIQVRGMINPLGAAEARLVAGLPLAVRQWLQGLTPFASSNQNNATASEMERVQAALKAWKMPLEYQLAGKTLFRTCFELRSPEPGQTEWSLAYFLQATDDAEFLIDAATIWQNPVESFTYQNRNIEQPQETFLRGLGLASRLYPHLAENLDSEAPTSCSLNPMQAYEFIKGVAWRFEDSGLGVILPPSLANREGWANRLGLKITAQTLQKQGRLNLQSLLNFEWQLAIGGQTISKAEFDKLVASNSPLVEINGEWVELRPNDIKTAQNFFASRKEQMSLSLEDALRLSSGDTQTIEKLPVVSFEASGALQELVTALTNNKAIATLPTPKDFKGELRPYQERGVAWLAFLERWGLGACLADDMGLGKCVKNDTFMYVNGKITTAEEIWKNYAGETAFDGEGFWANPTDNLLVNSIDDTSKIVQAPIKRLYRQEIQEKLRKVTLQDGSSITITRQHKLLTNKGWTNQLQVGDYVCVPAKLLWKGEPQDPDLVKFIAWQISEGHENKKEANLSITQKDATILEDLRLLLFRLSQKFSIKINQPSILINKKTGVSCLSLNSRSYQRFLESQGYQWGNLSPHKMIPSFIMQADLNSARIFLRNYFDAEGSVIYSMRSIEIASASQMIIQQLSTLLRRFGIWMRISPKQKCATNGSGIYRTYYIGTIGGNSARRFLEEIGFGIAEKQQKLEKICQLVSNTNVEGIPASDIVAEVIKTTGLPLRHFGMHTTVYINGTQQFSKESLQQVVVGLNKVISGEALQEYRQLKTSKWTNKTLEAYSSLNLEYLTVTQQSLQHLLNQEVFYCKIESIEDIDYSGWVYDFEVSKYHNFVANNIICHNTVQFIALLLHFKEQQTLEKPTLLVCPTSVLGNWEREFKKFAPTLKVLQYHGDKRPKGKQFETAVKKHDVLITSYSLIHRDLKLLQTVEWQLVVLDEAQNIKNSDAKQSQAVRQLETTFRVALTGTPVENRLQELWSILDFLNPGYLGNKQFFQRRFAAPVEKYGDTSSLGQLRSLVQPFILRRLKTDREIIQDLPEKQEMTVFCGLSSEQAKLYQQVVEESLAEIDEAEGVQRRGMILALLVKLKQVCNHPAQYLKQNSINTKDSGKLQRLDEMLDVALSEGDRALIFTQFAEWGKLLQPHLEKQLGREIFFLYGSTSKQQREEMVDRFQHDPQGPPVMILSLKAGGVGLNLTRANHVFHFDRWWNPAVENQATDRVFRIGQTRNVQVHKFVCTGTLEEKIHDMIESKKQLAEQVVGAGEQWLTELDTNQLRDLLLLDRGAVIDDE
ncbi:protein splicing site [Calothrix sp. NIES-4071]|nr:protein splicing site [Calothrix sp. NIES-4071]BAZ63426.1 protein splicing site [Calothrix sp. NIES-4105]